MSMRDIDELDKQNSQVPTPKRPRQIQFNMWTVCLWCHREVFREEKICPYCGHEPFTRKCFCSRCRKALQGWKRSKKRSNMRFRAYSYLWPKRPRQ